MKSTAVTPARNTPRAPVHAVHRGYPEQTCCGAKGWDGVEAEQTETLSRFQLDTATGMRSMLIDAVRNAGNIPPGGSWRLSAAAGGGAVGVLNRLTQPDRLVVQRPTIVPRQAE